MGMLAKVVTSLKVLQDGRRDAPGKKALIWNLTILILLLHIDTLFFFSFFLVSILESLSLSALKSQLERDKVAA